MGPWKGSRNFWIDELGYKFKMSNLQAAFGLGQLENIEVLIEAKEETTLDTLRICLKLMELN